MSHTPPTDPTRHDLPPDGGNGGSRHGELDDLLALHALGALEGDDLRRVEEHLETCPACRRRLAEHLGTADALAGAVEPVEPPAGARDELLRRAAGEGATVTRMPAAPTPRRDLILRVAAVLLLAVAAWALWSQADLRRQVERSDERNRQLSARLERAEGELEAVRTRLAATRAALETVASTPETVLAGLDPEDARGRLYAGRDGVLLVVDDLPRPAEGRTYQLWAIVGGTPVSAGLFTTGAGGEGFLYNEAPPSGDVELWAVTEEPAGGVPQPTGTMVLRG